MKAVKFAIGFAFVLSAASLAGNGFLYYRLDTEQSLLEKSEGQLAQLESSKASFQTQLTQFQQETDRLRGQVKDYVKQRDSLKTEVDQARTEIGDLKKQVKTLEDEKVELSKKINIQEVTDKAIVTEAAKVPTLPTPLPVPEPTSIAAPVSKEPAKEKAGEAKKKEAKKEEKKSEKPAEQPEKEEKAEAPAASAALGASKTATPDQRPRQVLSVNRQFNFVVVNMGLRDKVKVGDALRIEQNGKLIGKVQVEKLYENFSACTILEEVKPAKIQEGDLVRLA